MSRRPSLLEVVQGLLERTYRMRSGVDEVARFVIGDRGFRRFYARRDVATSAGSVDGSGARMLVRESAQGLRAVIYYPDAQIRRLESFPPQRGLGEENVDAFAALVEELDHLLLVGERTQEKRTVSLFELELHANVSKHLVLTRFLAGSERRIDDRRRVWLRHQLFEKGRYCDADPLVRQRYRDAARWAVRLIDALPRLPAQERISALRRFHAASAAGKLRLIGSFAS